MNLCMFRHESVADEANDDSDQTSKIIIADVHDEQIETVDTVIEIIEKDIEEIIIIEETIETAKICEPIVEDNSLFFKCKQCDFASARKSNLRNHKKQIHNWCFICFSSFTSQHNLKDQAHSENKADLDLVTGKAP